MWRLQPVEGPATKPGTRTDLGKRAKGPKLSPNPRDPLYFETATTLPVDFHSFRRAFNTALAEAGVNVQHAMHLASHSDPKAHARYVMRTAAMRAIPDAALPRLPGALPLGDHDDRTEDADVASPAKAPGPARIVTVRDDSTPRIDIAAKILSDYRAGGGNRTPDLARMKRPL